MIKILLKWSNCWLCLVAAALLLAITPLIATAAVFHVNATGGGTFSPEDIIINPGDTVMWTDTGQTATVTGDPSGSATGNIDSVCQETLNGLLTTIGQTYSHTFTIQGECHYVSKPGYPGMIGTVTVLPATGPNAYWLTPVDITTLPSTAQNFTASYSDPNGYLSLSDTKLTLTGNSRSETLHYSPGTNTFTLEGVGGSCMPGQAAALTDGNLTLDCSASSASGSGDFLTVTYNLTPQPTLSGYPYQLTISAMEVGGAARSNTPGTWIVNRPPSADTLMPMDNMGEAGMGQMFTAVYSDPDGWQNIAAANFYLSGNGGMHNEWLHYLAAPNLFTMMGTNDVCSPGQMKMLSNGSLNLDCSSSSISGSGNTLTVIFQVTPQMPSSGIMYDIFTAASDQAAGANATHAGTWMIE